LVLNLAVSQALEEEYLAVFSLMQMAAWDVEDVADMVVGLVLLFLLAVVVAAKLRLPPRGEGPAVLGLHI